MLGYNKPSTSVKAILTQKSKICENLYIKKYMNNRWELQSFQYSAILWI